MSVVTMHMISVLCLLWDISKNTRELGVAISCTCRHHWVKLSQFYNVYNYCMYSPNLHPLLHHQSHHLAPSSCSFSSHDLDALHHKVNSERSQCASESRDGQCMMGHWQAVYAHWWRKVKFKTFNKFKSILHNIQAGHDKRGREEMVNVGILLSISTKISKFKVKEIITGLRCNMKNHQFCYSYDKNSSATCTLPVKTFRDI